MAYFSVCFGILYLHHRCQPYCIIAIRKKRPWVVPHQQEELPSRLHMALESLKLCGVVVGGFALGLTQWAWLSYASHGSEYALIFLLLLVGLQLRNSGMSLKQILLNRRG